MKMYTHRICCDLWGFCRGQARSSLSYLYNWWSVYLQLHFVHVRLGLELLRSEMNGGIFGMCAAPFKHFVFCHFHILTVCFLPLLFSVLLKKFNVGLVLNVMIRFLF